MNDKPTVNDRYMAMQHKPNRDINGFISSVGRPLKLSPNAWLVYAWLLQHSKYNVNENEDHYYIYFNSFKNQDIADDLAISVYTVSNCRTELTNAGIMYKAKHKNKTVLIFPMRPEQYAMIYMPIDILRFFLSWETSAFPYKDTIVRIFGVLRMLRRGGADFYTVSALAEILGKDKGDMPTRIEIMTCCGMLRELGLITTEEYRYNNTKGKVCVRYNILNIADTIDAIKPYLENDDEATKYLKDTYQKASVLAKTEILLIDKEEN